MLINTCITLPDSYKYWRLSRSAVFSLSLKRSACGEELNNWCSSDPRELLSLQMHQRLTNKSWMAERNDVADVRFPQPQAPEIAPGLADVQQGEPAAQQPAQAEGPAGELEVIHSVTLT